IHGSLGKLPWQEENGLPYGSAIQNSLGKNIIGYEAASKASKEIKVIPENQKESKELSEAFELLYKAKRIYFLGFSYHNTNLERLNINRIAKVERQVNTTNRLEISRMKGTGFGLEKKELEAVKKWFINVPDPTIDALLFLKRHADLD
ncbi:MAG: hypothetical protein HYZ24_10480, partial [Chloroflexi bacterium]|nr:hypothetical protein [Chloroflexota bacterium]